MPEIETMQSRILVIDDNPAIYEDFCKVLSPGTLPSKALLDLASTIFDEVRKPTQTESYQIDFAPRGQDGVKKVQAALEEGWPYVIACQTASNSFHLTASNSFQFGGRFFMASALLKSV
jgi:CheY-like chemotaxis protein